LGVFSAGAASVIPLMAQFQHRRNNPGHDMMFRTAPLSVINREEMYEDSAVERMEFYQQIMRPIGAWHAAVGHILLDDTYLSPLGVLRARAAGPYEVHELRLLRVLTPRLRRAIRVMLRLSELDGKAKLAGEIVDGLSSAIVVTDRGGCIQSFNRAAEAILEVRDGLVVHNRVLRATNPGDTARLAQLILEAAGGHLGLDPRPWSAMKVTRPSQCYPFTLVINPLGRAGSPLRHPPRVSIAINDLTQRWETQAALLARLHDFTPKQSEVAALLAQGCDPRAVARTLGVSMPTVRTHIRRLMLKTDVDRLSELVRVICSGGVRQVP
jgi:DNA-binding CsgD family transcriptional regulator/PAS domain-containing protein